MLTPEQRHAIEGFHAGYGQGALDQFLGQLGQPPENVPERPTREPRSRRR